MTADLAVMVTPAVDVKQVTANEIKEHLSSSTTLTLTVILQLTAT